MLQQIYPTVAHPYAFELNKDFHFAAAHYIPCEDAGKCVRTHGHTYFVNLTIVGDELNHSGFLINFAALKKQIHEQFDHYLLNDLPQFKDKMPSTEVVAQTICQLTEEILEKQPNRPKCAQVYLRETPSSYVVYRPKEFRHG
ncbi:6-carboxytetrahydropterin synthase QueD [Staphylococcus simulans]|uniref:6-carboxy-5,6,7,8-tetrahydropterin synthase n=1 Tax=Staphylococcus simulans TaxID=1286 RepID=A0A6N3EHI4_STASI|nr:MULTISPECIES: 6-carboxytetrahydropterin synthase QueD [Staphylococcus]MBO0386094.1 6-carboxytetrahydropterin synthase QueD [Staphylococcus simulans]MBU6943392.1 6-carboxytetrahydropterin synthase QueD [Staphylococcus sp. CWZ226]MDN6062637.1 6-carboxytetrahydropterin synthase QueD [Staphylococcus simulans]MDN6232805.1 6-carboxytetrahydropterin synthase QueD [Staphylococcus simulans]MDN6260778.1 6-carboxytetrahydropterin synthase QueD [Staphylococcus simulans]